MNNKRKQSLCNIPDRILQPIFNGMVYDPESKIILTACSSTQLGKSVKGKIVWFKK